MNLLKKLIVGIFVISIYVAMAGGLAAGISNGARFSARLFHIELLIRRPELIHEASTVLGLIFLLLLLFAHLRDRKQEGTPESWTNIGSAIAIGMFLGFGIVVLVFVGLGIARLLMFFADPMFSLIAGHFLAAALMIFGWTRIPRTGQPRA